LKSQNEDIQGIKAYYLLAWLLHRLIKKLHMFLEGGKKMRISEHPILEFPKKREVSFIFEGQELKGLEGEPIAAALHANGIKTLRYCQHRFRIPQFPRREIPHPGIKLFSFYHPPY
jgi:hypothetical protein